MNILLQVKARSSTLFAFADQAIFSGSNFLLALFLPRKEFIGIEEFGLYFLIWMVVLFCSSFHQETIVSPMLTLGAKKGNQEQESYMGQLFYLQVIFTLLAGLGSYLVVLFFKPYLGNWNAPIIDLILPFTVMSFLMVDFYKKQAYLKGKSHLSLLINVANYICLFSLLAVFQMDQVLALESLYFSLTIGLTFAMLVGAFTYRYKLFNKVEFFKVVLQHYQFSKWLVMKAGLQWASGNYYIIAAGNILQTTVAVGVIRIVQTWMGFFNAFFQVLENIIPVHSARHYAENGFFGMRSYLIKNTGKSSILIFPFLLVLFFGSEWILDFFYGQEIAEFSYILKGFCILYLVIFFGYPLRFALRTIEETRPLFVGYFLSGLFCILSANLVVEAYHAAGVVLGLIFAQIVTLGYYLFILIQKQRTH